MSAQDKSRIGIYAVIDMQTKRQAVALAKLEGKNLNTLLEELLKEYISKKLGGNGNDKDSE